MCLKSILFTQLCSWYITIWYMLYTTRFCFYFIYTVKDLSNSMPAVEVGPKPNLFPWNCSSNGWGSTRASRKLNMCMYICVWSCSPMCLKILQHLMRSKIAKANFFFAKGHPRMTSPWVIANVALSYLSLYWIQLLNTYWICRLMVFQAWTCRFEQHRDRYDLQTMQHVQKRSELRSRFGFFIKRIT